MNKNVNMINIMREMDVVIPMFHMDHFVFIIRGGGTGSN